MMMATPRVLIVDDDPVIREMLKAYLERDGYEVLCAETAEEAETILEQQMIDLLMLDIRLPGKDGLVHISQIVQERVNNVRDFLNEGDDVIVKVLDIDNRNRVKLSIKEITEEEKAAFEAAEADVAS